MMCPLAARSGGLSVGGQTPKPSTEIHGCTDDSRATKTRKTASLGVDASGENVTSRGSQPEQPLDTSAAQAAQYPVKTGPWDENEMKALIDVMKWVFDKKRSSERWQTMTQTHLFYEVVPLRVAEKTGQLRCATSDEGGTTKRKRSGARKASSNVYYRKWGEIKLWASTWQAQTDPEAGVDAHRASSMAPSGAGDSGDEGVDIDDRPQADAQTTKKLSPLQTKIAQYFTEAFPLRRTGVGLEDDLPPEPDCDEDPIDLTKSAGSSSSSGHRVSDAKKKATEAIVAIQASLDTTRTDQNERHQELLAEMKASRTNTAQYREQLLGKCIGVGNEIEMHSRNWILSQQVGWTGSLTFWKRTAIEFLVYSS